jgi:hypothetical protein
MLRLMAIVVAGSLAIVAASEANAAIAYGTIGSTYSQNFDSLPNSPQNTSLGDSPVGWTDDNPAPGAGNFSIEGVYLYHVTSQTEGGFNGHQRMRIGAGTATTGAFMSFGASGLTERALGSLASNTTAAVADGGVQYMGLRFTNDTAQTLNAFTLSYSGEQWRDGGSTTTPNAQSITFGYKVGAANIQDTGFTGVAALDFTSPVFTAATGTAVDGNAAGKVAKGPVTVTGVLWAPGTDLWIRWDDINNSGNDHGLAIDDLVFSAVPEASSFLFAGLVGCVYGIGRVGRRVWRTARA